MYLFIDTNIFLNFYHFSSDDLEELNKLSVLLKNNEIHLFIPEQVKDEFYRNRENKIVDALKEFRKDKIDKPFPQMTKQYEEYKKLREAIKIFDSEKQVLLEKLLKDVSSESLKADLIISQLFQSSIIIKRTEEILQAARNRHEIGNPPGKRDSLGDAINWESLLTIIPSGQELSIISDDGDYHSELNSDIIKPALRREWADRKGASLNLYRNLTAFFKKNFPKIRLAQEYEKTLLIERLSKSGSFATTHSVLSQLATYTDFSASEINDIVLACISNNQIYWISTDHDIQENLAKIINPNADLLDRELYKMFFEVFAPQEDDSPF